MTIQQFIERAIEGGWKKPAPQLSEYVYHMYTPGWGSIHLVNSYHELLDPEAWKAVGKVEGWRQIDRASRWFHQPWLEKMHRLVDALAEGKTIEAYLETL